MIEIFRLTTDPAPCPYLADRDHRLKVRLLLELNPTEYAHALAGGWRRFGRTLFAPRCSTCQECVPIRVDVPRFCPSRSQRRVLRRNHDVRIEIGEPRVDAERLDLYRRFHEARSRQRGWPSSSMDRDGYHQSFVDNAVDTLEFRYWLGKRLVGVAYVGEASNALNSIYAFSDPELSRRSLGTLDVLAEVSEAARRGKEHLYLGFLVDGCRSMAYKAGFRPHQVLDEGEWRNVG